jgi:cytochrome b pre-mRNA-processing protein 3
MKLPRLFKESPTEAGANRLYARAIEQARQPAFYLSSGVADTPDGRFDMIALHVGLLLRRLRRDRHITADFAQALFDLMFSDMDQNLREMGIGDIGVGKRIKAMAKAFYGRLAAYEAGLESAEDDELVAALKRNLYRKTSPREDQVAGIVAYMRREADALDSCGVERVMAAEFSFGPPPTVDPGGIT